jgi:riboflavin synthase
VFTGLVQGIGQVLEKRSGRGGVVLSLEADFDLTDPCEGESIAVNGICLTARDISGRRFLADVSPETISCTGLSDLSVGSRVNLERAMRLCDRLGGHMVSGHVDTVGAVKDRRPAGDFTLFSFSLEQKLVRYVIEKGSIAINGVSLTVNSCDNDSFSVSVIPHTLNATTLGLLQAGDSVNIEVDVIGKYVEKLLGGKVADGRKGKINSSFLAEHGFF